MKISIDFIIYDIIYVSTYPSLLPLRLYQGVFLGTCDKRKWKVKLVALQRGVTEGAVAVGMTVFGFVC